MRLDDKIVSKKMVCHHSKFSFLILFGLAEVCFKQMFECFIMAAIIIPVTEKCSASKRLPQLLHFAIPAFFSNLKCNQTFEGYFGSAETSTNNRFSNFLLVDIFFENIKRILTCQTLALLLLETIFELNTLCAMN